ncbi:MAG: 1,4-alpha-glucan branching enzyme, partial [Rhodobacterales bacterium 32-66-7]
MTALDPATAAAITGGWHGDPFAVLGPHKRTSGWEITAFVPGAERLWVVTAKTEVEAQPYPGQPGLFTHPMPRKLDYRLRAEGHGNTWEFDDPFRFGPVLGELDEYLLGEGTHRRLWQVLGAHIIRHEGVDGVHFAVWAPNAERVSVVGDFNIWDGRRHPMRRRGPTGVWEIFVPGLGEGA